MEVKTKFLGATLGTVSTDNDGYIDANPASGDYASYAYAKITVPYANMLEWGASWLICYEDADHNLHYPYGDSDRDPNTLSSFFFVDPRTGYCFTTRIVYYFTESMMTAPQLKYNKPVWQPSTTQEAPYITYNTPPEYVDIYVRYGSGVKNIYRDAGTAAKYNDQGEFIGSNYYINRNYCKIITKEAYFAEHAGYPYRLEEDMPSTAPKLFEFDCPDMLWRTDSFTNNGMIYSPLIPGMVLSGAFKDVVTLEQITIPRSCQRIGPVAFAGTSLRKVMISAECEYSETSFPEGCEVEFYEGGGEYAQLYDCNGFAIIDCNRARIYIT